MNEAATIDAQVEQVTADSAGPICITQDTRERRIAGDEYLAACAITASEVMRSIHCPTECGGHPVCKPCLTLARKRGLVR